jgi:DMSO/TMAO reductase YedYZ molybdopterin-dependent catalytic subunit
MLGLLLAGCTAQPASPTAVSTATLTVVAPVVTAALALTEIPPTLPAATATSTAQDNSTACNLVPILVPTLPATIPGYTELDESTGLHMTGTVQQVDLASYLLKVTGLVDHPLSLSYDELRCLPKVTDNPPLVCVGFFRDVASWSGVPIKYVLELAGVQVEARSVTLISADAYRTTVSLEEAQQLENFLAYELEGKPLPVLHGFPLRAVFPGLEGNKWAKWVVGIEVE